MRRAVLSLAIVAALAFVGCRTRVQFPADTMRVPVAGAAAAGPVGWADVRQPAAGFACQMPAIPQVEAVSGIAEDGASYETLRARASAPFGSFAMIVTQWEGGVVGDPLTIGRELAETVLELAETSDARARRVTMPGFYAREDTGLSPDGAFFAMRQFFGRDRIYVAIASVRRDPMGLRAAEQFMESIALDRRDAILPVGEEVEPVPIYLPDVDFSVTMPPLAARRAIQIDIEGAADEAWSFESRHAGGGVYRVTVIVFEDGAPEDALEHTATSLSLGSAAEYVHASGFPGRTYEPSDGHEVRAFVTAHRVYVLEVTAAGALGADAADAFFGSFRIL